MEPFAIFAINVPDRQGYITLESILLVAVCFLGLGMLIPHLIPIIKPLVNRVNKVVIKHETANPLGKRKTEIELDLGVEGVPGPVLDDDVHAEPKPKAKENGPPSKRPDPKKTRKAASEATKRARRSKRKATPPEPPDDKAA